MGRKKSPSKKNYKTILYQTLVPSSGIPLAFGWKSGYISLPEKLNYGYKTEMLTMKDCVMTVFKLSSLNEILRMRSPLEEEHQLDKLLNKVDPLCNLYETLKKEWPEFIQHQNDYKEKTNRKPYSKMQEENPGMTGVLLVRDVLCHMNILIFNEKLKKRELINEYNYLNVDKFSKVFLIPIIDSLKVIHANLKPYLEYTEKEFNIHYLYFRYILNQKDKSITSNFCKSESAKNFMKYNCENLLDQLKFNWKGYNERNGKNVTENPIDFLYLMSKLLLHPNMLFQWADKQLLNITKIFGQLPDIAKLDDFDLMQNIFQTNCRDAVELRLWNLDNL